MAKTRRSYTGASVSTTTSSAIAASGTTTFTVSAATNWPYGADPFYVVLSPGTASEEKVLVTRTNTGDTTLNISSDAVRGLDGTSAVSHDAGTTVYPVFTAVDADEANELASMWESKGDIVSHGASTFARLAVGSDDTVLIADASTSSGLAWGQVATAGIAADAVNGTKIADDSIDSEHYVDGSIDTAHLADGAVTAAKIATGAVGADALEATAVTAASYGDADSVGQFTVDADGRLTAAANVDISIASAAVSDATDANTASKIVKRDASGDFSAGNVTASLTGNVTGNVTGNADTATALATSRTIQLTGDVTGSASFDGSANASIATTVAANSVALGTDTTGNYVADVDSGDGIVVTGSDGEGVTKTVAVDSTVLRGKAGNGTYYPDANGYITITTGVSGTIVAAFVQTTSQTTTGEGSPEYVLTLPVTNINGQYVTCRLYEVNGSGNGDYTVSTIFDSSPPGINVSLSWLVLT